MFFKTKAPRLNKAGVNDAWIVFWLWFPRRIGNGGDGRQGGARQWRRGDFNFEAQYPCPSNDRLMDTPAEAFSANVFGQALGVVGKMA